MPQSSLAELTESFRSAEFLPPLPEAALRVVELIDQPEVSTRQVLAEIANDPHLAANLIRLASSAAFYGLGKAATTLEAAVLRLGLDQVRMLTMSFSIRSALWNAAPSEGFDPRRFAAHSHAVAEHAASLADALQAGPRMAEAFAIGLLHDVPTCLLAHVAPTAFDRCWYLAAALDCTFEASFEREFGESPAILARAASEAWKLPQLNARRPAWLRAAHDLAALDGAGFEDWTTESAEELRGRVQAFRLEHGLSLPAQLAS